MSTTLQRLRRRLIAVSATGALTAGALAFATAPAQAASVTTTAPTTAVKGATLTWGLNGEQGGGAFFGICNFLSAGKAGNTGASRPWTEADGFYKTADSNVTVEKPNAAGDYNQPSWNTKCQDKNGATVSAASTASLTGNRVKIAAGTGSFDTATGAGSIQWTGSFTSAFYGGLTYWTATNPKLTVAADGTGTLTATLSGYGADMNDPTKWEALPEQAATLATFKDVKLSNSGFTATPGYLGTSVTATGTPQAAKTSANEAYWGSFPQSFVDYQIKTGQSSYWYTSGGSRDAAKPATPFSVSYTAAPAKVTVSQTTVHAGDNTTELTVSGTGFDPALATGTRPPFAGVASGAYIAFGRFADTWRPSQGGTGRNIPSGANGNGSGVKWAVPAASFAASSPAQDPNNAAYTYLQADGSFSTTIKVNQTWLSSVSGNFGIYTYAAGGPTVAAYETGTPLTFETPKADATVSLDKSSYYTALGTPAEVKATVQSGGAAAAGEVELVLTPQGGEAKVVDDATLDTDGKATLEVPADESVVGTLKVTYGGSSTVNAASSAESTIEVDRRDSTLELDALSYAGFAGNTVPVKISVKDGDDAADGTVALSYFPADGEPSDATSADEATLDADGEATLVVPSTLAAGEYKLIATYAGTSTLKNSSFTVPLVLTEKTSADVAVSAPTVGYHTDAKVTVSLPSDATGSVTLKGAGADVTADVTDGSAQFTLPELAAGTYALTAVYSGDATYKASNGLGQLVVTQKPTSVSIGAVKTHSYGNVVTLTASVEGATVGSVKFTEGSTSYGTATVKGGKASVTLPTKLAVGSHTVKATFSPTNTSAAISTASVKVTVQKVATTTALNVTKKPTTTATGTINVRVRQSVGVSLPRGTITVKLTRGGVTKTVKKSFTDGFTTLTLPKVSSKGTWKVTATFSATALHNGSSKASTFAVK